MYVFIPPPLPDWGRPKAVEPWTVKLCRDMLWSEIFVWVTAQHGVLEGWLAALQPCTEKPWAQLNECSRRWQKQLSEEALGSHPECRGCEQEHCSGLLPDTILFIYKNLQKYLIPLLFFFSPSWTSWSAQPLQCSQAHLLQRCLPACFNALLTSIDICVKREDRKSVV